MPVRTLVPRGWWQGQVPSVHRPAGLVSSLVWGYGVSWFPRLMPKDSHSNLVRYQSGTVFFFVHTKSDVTLGTTFTVATFFFDATVTQLILQILFKILRHFCSISNLVSDKIDRVRIVPLILGPDFLKKWTFHRISEIFENLDFF